MCCRLFPGRRQVALHPGGEKNVAAQPKALVLNHQHHPRDRPSPTCPRDEAEVQPRCEKALPGVNLWSLLPIPYPGADSPVSGEDVGALGCGLRPTPSPPTCTHALRLVHVRVIINIVVGGRQPQVLLGASQADEDREHAQARPHHRQLFLHICQRAGEGARAVASDGHCPPQESLRRPAHCVSGLFSAASLALRPFLCCFNTDLAGACSPISCL